VSFADQLLKDLQLGDGDASQERSAENVSIQKEEEVECDPAEDEILKAIRSGLLVPGVPNKPNVKHYAYLLQCYPRLVHQDLFKKDNDVDVNCDHSTSDSDASASHDSASGDSASESDDSASESDDSASASEDSDYDDSASESDDSASEDSDYDDLYYDDDDDDTHAVHNTQAPRLPRSVNLTFFFALWLVAHLYIIIIFFNLKTIASHR